MRGFVYIINKDNSNADSLLHEKMSSVNHHRGPIEEGFFMDGSAGFYIKRLSIIDLSTGRQPKTFKDSTIVYNGEITLV
jgi:asparagine synthase (glutamine-hydrolysing)